MAKQVEAQVQRVDKMRQEMWAIFVWSEEDDEWWYSHHCNVRAEAQADADTYRGPVRIVHFVLE